MTILKDVELAKLFSLEPFEPLPVTTMDPSSPRYIERFRHGPPQSREERQHLDYASEDKHHPFWWIPDSELPHSSTPTKATNTGIFLLYMCMIVSNLAHY